MDQDSPPPFSRRARPPAVGGVGPAGDAPGALVQWIPPRARIQIVSCLLRDLYEAIPVPKQGPAWQRWVTGNPVPYELPARVKTDVPVLL